MHCPLTRPLSKRPNRHDACTDHATKTYDCSWERGPLVLGLATLLKSQADPTAWPRDYLYDWADHFEWKLCGRPLAGDSAVGDPPGAHHWLEKNCSSCLTLVYHVSFDLRVCFIC
jgi:hypothetical protein